MNILPKKSWHVYNEENRLRVFQDEEKERVREEFHKKRAETAEIEHRMLALRKKARIAGYEGQDQEEEEIPSVMQTTENAVKHINLWENELAKEKEKELPGNKEYAEEKKKKDYKMERYFKQYLGETAQITEKRWFEKPYRVEDYVESYASQSRKEREDPLNSMKRIAKAMENTPESIPRKKESSTPVANSKDALRKQRLEREKAERERQQKLLARLGKINVPEDKEDYSEQYNPRLTKRAHEARDSRRHRLY